jgi:hypothetical protein
VTDSEVNKKRSLNFKLLPIEGTQMIGLPRWILCQATSDLA